MKGFKSIALVEKLRLEPINVLIGPNGSGKTNFIEVFAFLHAIRDGRLQEYVTRAGGAERLLHYGSKVTAELELFLSFEGGKNQYEIKLAPTSSDQLFPSSESVFFWDKRYPRPYEESLARSGDEAGISRIKSSKIATYVQQHFAKWRLYHFHDTSASSPMKKTADLNDNRFLRADGSNLASFLHYLRERHDASYNLIRNTVRRVAPFFKDFVLEPQKLNEEKIRLEWKHEGSDAYFDSSSFSDGTLRFIALATLLLQPQSYRPSVVLMDEPELGLHPYAITMLGSLVKKAAAETQIILSTQSPLLLDQFRPEDVLVADRRGGATEFTRLDSENLASWLEDYSLGQLWEKNEIGGRPSSERRT